jgi:hypothetical protein
MSALHSRIRACLLLLLSSPLLSAAPAPAPPEEGVPPEPPRQGERWAPPKHRLPVEWVRAADTLFQQGLADPRGCEYRVVRVTVVKGGFFRQTSDTSPMTTHAWVLPVRPGDPRRYAVGWSGLVVPVDFVGDKADLAADVRTSVRYAKGADRDEILAEWPVGSVAWSLWYKNLDPFAGCLLLRAGEGELASQLWEAYAAGSKLREPYTRLAAAWLGHWLNAAFDAHRCGEDARALFLLRRIGPLEKQLAGEAKKRPADPEDADPEFNARTLAQGFELVPDVLADQERRAREKKREPVVCLGPGRMADPKKRIAALIARLDEVTNAVDRGEDDAVIRALIREGEPAVEPLLKCLEKDNRLTRQIYRQRFSSLPGWCVFHVHEAADRALNGILERQGIAVDRLYRDGSDDRRLFAEKVRSTVKAMPGLSPAERRLRVFMDDRADDQIWVAAAEAVFESDSSSEAASTWDSRRGQAVPQAQLSRRRPVDAFRDRKNPSVTDVLLKQAERKHDFCSLDRIAFWLASWDAAAARAVLPEWSGRVRESGDLSTYRYLLLLRIKIGDRRALDEYAEWLRTAPPTVMEKDSFGDTFQLMWENPDHPGMAAAARALFGEKGAWLPLWPLAETVGSKHRFSIVRSLVQSPLLRVEPFRKAVLAGLAEKSRAGFAKVHSSESGLIEWSEGVSSGFSLRLDPLVWPDALRGDFRVCDYFANLISTYNEAAPRCELYWPEPQRQAAVEACARFLTRYGDQLTGQYGAIAFPKLDSPADPEQVRKGLAIFSLAGEGERRVVRLPAFPMKARWTTLKDIPFKKYDVERRDVVFAPRLTYLQEGHVWQAEEVFKDGKWQRYYGFTGAYRIARVPAEEIEIPPQGHFWRVEGGPWVPLAGGLDGRLLVPPLPVDPDVDGDARFPADTPLRFAVALRNRTGLDLRVADLPPGTRLRLWHSPETVSRKGELVPAARHEEDWAEQPLKSTLKLSGFAEKTPGPTAEFTACTIDLRDNFDLRKPGFYRLRLTRDGADTNREREVWKEIRFSLAPK